MDIAATSTSSIAVGAVAGQNTGTITGARVTGTIAGMMNTLSFGYGVGGLVGYMGGGTVTASHANATVSTPAGQLAGGLVGFVGFGTLSNSFSTGSVSANQYAGGFTGYLYNGVIQNNWSTSTVNAITTRAGGMIGYSNGAISKCYVANMTLTGGGAVSAVAGAAVGGSYANTYYEAGIRNTSGLGVAVTTTNLSFSASFGGFDFTPGSGVWTMPLTNNARAATIAPVLNWQCTDWFDPINCN